MNPANGLILDKTADNWPASIAATGLALAAYPIGVERQFWPQCGSRVLMIENYRSGLLSDPIWAISFVPPVAPRHRRHP